MTTRKSPVAKSSALIDEICDRMAEGESLRAICRLDHMPSIGAVLRWISEDDKLKEQYARAMAVRADAIFEELLDIADDGQNDWMEKQLNNGDTITVANHEHITRSRLRVDARRWMLGKMEPKKYSDLMRQELTGKDGAALNPAKVSDAQLAAALNALAHNGPAQHIDPIEDPDDASDLV